jgi:hypothetical protein
MRAVRFLLYISIILLLGIACDSNDVADNNPSDSNRDADVDSSNADEITGDEITEGGSRLSRSALGELESMHAGDFFGKAVVKNEQMLDNAVKVTFEPDSGPICLRGGEFSMFYTDRGSDKTLIMLNGGGACWSALCSATETVSDEIRLIGPTSSDPGNYFGDWNVVTVPYCDGSVFSGDNEVIEPDGSTRYHHGRQNLVAALDQTKEHFGNSTQILIAGFSAGGYGTITAMIAVRLLFPDVDLFVMNDSGPGVQNPANTEGIQQRIEEWKNDQFIPPSCTACQGGYGQMSQMFKWMLDNDKTAKVSVMSYYEDRVIGGVFNGMSGPEYQALLVSETDKIHELYPDRFKRYMLPGAGHVVSGSWSTVTADGVKVSDWVTAMVTGDDSVWTDILASGP